MTPAQKNFAACLFLALVFGSSSAFLARENAHLRKQVSSLELSSGNSLALPRTRSVRKKTVGSFLAREQERKTAKELLWELILTSQAEIGPKPLLSEIYLPQLSAEELARLRLEISAIDCPASYRHQILELIAVAESRFHKNSPEALFDHLVSTAGIYHHFREEFSKWAQRDPGAALAWFTSKTSPADFQNGELFGSGNRDRLFGALLEGLAEVDLALAIGVIEKEPSAATIRNIPWSVVQEIIEDARATGSDDFSRRLLKSHPSGMVQSDDPFSQANFWTEFTRATGDLDRSVSLLVSLDQDKGNGIAMAEIIRGTTGYSYEEKANWLAESLTTPTDLIQGISEISTNGDPGNPFSDGLHPEAMQWLGTLGEGEVKNGLLASFSGSLTHSQDYSEAYRLGAQITDPIQRQETLQEVAQDWFGENPGEATQHLPSELLKSLTE